MPLVTARGNGTDRQSKDKFRARTGNMNMCNEPGYGLSAIKINHIFKLLRHLS